MEIITDAVIEKLDDVLDFVDAALEDWGCPMKALNQINIAVEEMFVNIAHYAYGKDKGTATIEITESGGVVEITLTDSGMPYNPLAKPDPDVTLSAEEREIGGLGIYMVKKIMDDVSYEHRGGCNVFTMRKKVRA